MGETNTVFEEMAAPWFETKLLTILSNHWLAGIYNTDEYRLFCAIIQALPGKTMHFKKEKCVGGKLSKQRLTGLAAGHDLGQKLPSFIYGKANKAKVLQIFERSSLPPKKC